MRQPPRLGATSFDPCWCRKFQSPHTAEEVGDRSGLTFGDVSNSLFENRERVEIKAGESDHKTLEVPSHHNASSADARFGGRFPQEELQTDQFVQRNICACIDRDSEHAEVPDLSQLKPLSLPGNECSSAKGYSYPVSSFHVKSFRRVCQPKWRGVRYSLCSMHFPVGHRCDAICNYMRCSATESPHKHFLFTCLRPRLTSHTMPWRRPVAPLTTYIDRANSWVVLTADAKCPCGGAPWSRNVFLLTPFARCLGQRSQRLRQVMRNVVYS